MKLLSKVLLQIIFAKIVYTHITILYQPINRSDSMILKEKQLFTEH